MTVDQARVNFENKVYTLMNDLDPSGYHANKYKEFFSKMNNKEFIDFVRRLRDEEWFNLFFEMNQTDMSKSPNLEKMKKIGEKYDVPFTEYVKFPYKRPDDPDKAPISATKLPVLIVSIRPLQQMLDKKNVMISSTDSINILTGQVTGDSKASTMTNMQTISLATSNQLTIIKEMLGPRGDDAKAKEKMLEQIESTGTYDVTKAGLKTQDKQALETFRVMMVSSGLLVSFGNAKTSYVLPVQKREQREF